MTEAIELFDFAKSIGAHVEFTGSYKPTNTFINAFLVRPLDGIGMCDNLLNHLKHDKSANDLEEALVLLAATISDKTIRFDEHTFDVPALKHTRGYRGSSDPVLTTKMQLHDFDPPITVGVAIPISCDYVRNVVQVLHQLNAQFGNGVIEEITINLKESNPEIRELYGSVKRRFGTTTDDRMFKVEDGYCTFLSHRRKVNNG